MVVRVTIESSGAEDALDRFARAIKNPRGALDEIADVFTKAEREVFATKRSPTPWKPLSSRYARWKARHGGGDLMVRTGKLRDSLTRRPVGIEDKSGGTITLGTDVYYARFHKNRRVLWVSATHKNDMKRRVQTALEEAIR